MRAIGGRVWSLMGWARNQVALVMPQVGAPATILVRVGARTLEPGYIGSGSPYWQMMERTD